MYLCLDAPYLLPGGLPLLLGPLQLADQLGLLLGQLGVSGENKRYFENNLSPAIRNVNYN